MNISSLFESEFEEFPLTRLINGKYSLSFNTIIEGDKYLERMNFMLETFGFLLIQEERVEQNDSINITYRINSMNTRESNYYSLLARRIQFLIDKCIRIEYFRYFDYKEDVIKAYSFYCPCCEEERIDEFYNVNTQQFESCRGLPINPQMITICENCYEEESDFEMFFSNGCQESDCKFYQNKDNRCNDCFYNNNKAIDSFYEEKSRCVIKLRFLEREGYHKAFLPSIIQSVIQSTSSYIKFLSSEVIGQNLIFYWLIENNKEDFLLRTLYNQYGGYLHLENFTIGINKRNSNEVVFYRNNRLSDIAKKSHLYYPFDLNNISEYAKCIYDYYHIPSLKDIEEMLSNVLTSACLSLLVNKKTDKSISLRRNDSNIEKIIKK